MPFTLHSLGGSYIFVSFLFALLFFLGKDAGASSETIATILLAVVHSCHHPSPHARTARVLQWQHASQRGRASED